LYGQVEQFIGLGFGQKLPDSTADQIWRTDSTVRSNWPGVLGTSINPPAPYDTNSCQRGWLMAGSLLAVLEWDFQYR
jgi:hypothetical protein